MKVLVVDDDAVVLEVTAAVLEGLGHEVIRRADAPGTSAVVREERPEVALVDLEMPGLPGEELVRRVQAEELETSGRETAFIFYSGRSREELDRLVEESGVAGAIDKASGPAGLARQFSTIVEKL